MEVSILFMLILIEVSVLIFKFVKKSDYMREVSFIRIFSLSLFIILILTKVIDWNFKWLMLSIFLTLQALIGLLSIIKDKQITLIKPYKVFVSSVFKIILIIMLMIPTIMFPQFKNIEPLGEYEIGTTSYTLTDNSREEYFTEEDDYRKVTIQLWYPSNPLQSKDIELNERFPLIIFSHGAFGFRMSNYSTFQELASNGYVVCSIDHTYHSFFTKQVNDKNIIGNMEFIKNAMDVQNGVLDKSLMYDLEKKWMELRTSDMKFVLNYIKNMVENKNPEVVFSSIDIEKIGVMGHSLGGATSAQIGRDLDQIDSVIVIDGTMLGEIIGFKDGKEIINNSPYPKPILNIYSESHYAEACQEKDNYPNMICTNNALNSYQVVINDAGHINFTDLPLVSPPLAKLLGIGPIDPKYCLETTNKIVVEFFDNTLKSNQNNLAKERVY